MKIVKVGTPKPARDRAALLAYIDSRQNTPYAWGRSKNDCVSFVLGAVKAQTGRTVASHLKWETEKTALRRLKEVGGLEAVFDQYFVRIPPAKAERGDIAGIEDETFGIHTGIVEGEKIVGPGERGNKRFPRRAMIIAWSAVEKKSNE